ncbi:hypothetical protein DGWBC_1507 [Dehalogenimonas sp. WBC-2]|nr:hypothetical protein DGWBC_1507 [Dehalogenimonas sp. WBC-2]
MLIVAVVGTAFMLALAASSKAVILAGVRTTSESLAHSQLESVKAAAYSYYNGPDPAGYPVIDPADYGVDDPLRYNVTLAVAPLNADGTPVSNTGGQWDADLGLQLIVITIYHDDNGDNEFTPDEQVLSLDNYKSAREAV